MSNVRTDLLTNADVTVDASTDRGNKAVAEITVNGEFKHRFSANSRVSKALELMTPLQLQERLDGGHFFFVNGALFDFRDGTYNGFVHTDESIEALKNTIGIRLERDKLGRRVQNTQGPARLSKVWSTREIQVPGMDSGGVFNSRLTFNWNPFVETIRSSFDIVRLICTNGMTGLNSLFSAKIPLINRWEEHLDIADKQIQNRLFGMLGQRFSNMVSERATLNDVLRLRDHARERLDTYMNTADGERREKLRNIVAAVSPELHLSEVYKTSAMEDRRLAAQLPSHLSAFDAYNIATELASHTNPTSKSSDNALDRFANELVFDRNDKRAHAARFDEPLKAAFSDPDTAFFGDVKI